MSEFYNDDCMKHLAEYPDNYFDLAVVDPPYGGGGTERVENGALDGRFGNKGSRFERYRGGGRDTSPMVSEKIKASRTGGKWAAKFGKKSLRGMLPQMKHISKSCFASHAIK